MAVIRKLDNFISRMDASPLKAIKSPHTRVDLARLARMHLVEKMLGAEGIGNCGMLSRAAEMWIRSDDAGHDVKAMHAAWIELAS